MQDNPYQPPPETHGILRDEEQNGTDLFASATKATLQQKQVPKPTPSNQHHFWIALAACPLAGPILTILMITALGFFFLASGAEGSEQANPMALIFFPVTGLLITVPINYVAMAVTFLPSILFFRKKAKLQFIYILACWIISLVQIIIFGSCFALLNALAFERAGGIQAFTNSISFGLSFAMVFAPTTLISAFTFWLLNLRGKTASVVDTEHP